MSLVIHNLHARVSGGQEILRGLNLEIQKGSVHAIMGPNGSGKSTLSKVISGHPDYEVTSGEVLLDGVNVLAMEPDARARAGLFLAFQYPVEIPGVSNANFIRAALQARLKDGEELDAVDYYGDLYKEMDKLEIPRTFTSRSVNEGFSGGEKKRNEVLQMAMLKPAYAILDETDSGLDIDALKIVAAPFSDHQRGEPLPERAVVRAGLPNRDLFGLPRFNGTDSQGACGHERDVAAAGGAGILCEGDGMEINHACAELPILGRGRRCILISSDTPHRIVESPMLGITLPALHDGTTNAPPTRGVRSKVRLRKMQVGIGNRKFGPDATEAQFAVGAFEGEGVRDGRFLSVEIPLVHAPEVGRLKAEPKFIDNPRNQRELFRRTNGTADPDGIVRRRLPPGSDVFERLGEVEIFQGVVEDDSESLAGKPGHRLRCEAGGFFNQGVVEGRVVPPVRRDSAQFSWHVICWFLKDSVGAFQISRGSGCVRRRC